MNLTTALREKCYIVILVPVNPPYANVVLVRIISICTHDVACSCDSSCAGGLGSRMNLHLCVCVQPSVSPACLSAVVAERLHPPFPALPRHTATETLPEIFNSV